MSSNPMQPSGQPMPRMTDSMANQAGPGPSSFKLAALSANSFHLDSPPFTGTAGPLGHQLSRSHQPNEGDHSLSSTLREESHVRPGESHNRSHGALDPHDMEPRRNNSQARSDSHGSRGQGSDEIAGSVSSHERNPNVDVPHWDLDASRPDLPDNEQGDHGIHNSSLSPPPFSSASQGPIPISYNRTGTTANAESTTQARSSRQREASRPVFTEISEGGATSNMEDAASSAADGDVDVVDDADAEDTYFGHHVEADGEVDGDEDPYVVRGPNGAGGPARRMPLQSQTKDEYRFPKHRLPTRMHNESKIPLVIVACGSFSPPTYLHLRIFEMAKDQVIESGKYELLGGYYSPVSDYYRKEGLAKATHRVRMCELAVEKTSTWLMVDAWESLQDEYQRTAVVLDHFDEEINGGPSGGVLLSDGSRRRIRVMLLAGGDLIQSMGEPGVWADADLNHILGKYGCMIVERTGADVWSFLLSHDLLWRYRKNLKIVKQTIFNDISSSKVRLFVRRGQSIKYLLPNSVIHYIEQYKLYRLPKELDTEPPDADLELFE